MMLLLCPVFVTWSSADYALQDNEIKKQYMPALFELDTIIGNFGDNGLLRNPSDLFIAHDDTIYVCDTDNQRVIRLDADGKVLKVYNDAYGANKQRLNAPQGIFVDADYSVYIADTMNGRIVHLAEDGSFIEEFFQPAEDTYDTDYPFYPTKVALNDRGNLIVSNRYDYHGLIYMDGNDRFLGYVGASKIELTFTDRFLRLFATAQQKKQMAREVPPYYSNFTIDKKGFLYTSSYWAKTGQIKKLSAAGNNILPMKLYGEENESTTFNGLPGFADVAVTDQGFFYAADAVSNKIYLYDSDGNNIAVFGGSGNCALQFERIASIAVDSKGNLLVLDGVLGVVQKIRPTGLTNKLIQMFDDNAQGKYEEALPLCKDVLSVCELHYFANIGLARAADQNGDLQLAMRLYQAQMQKEAYSEVFEEYRLDVLRRWFIPIVLAVILLLALCAAAIRKLSRLSKKYVYQPLPVDGKYRFKMVGRLLTMQLFHPLDSFDKIKQYRRKLPVWLAPIGFLLLACTVLLTKNALHFPLSSNGVSGPNIWQQLATFFLPLFSFIGVGYGICTISDGKQTFLECTTASVLCFLPYVVCMPLLTLCSYLMSFNEKPLYDVLSVRRCWTGPCKKRKAATPWQFCNNCLHDRLGSSPDQKCFSTPFRSFYPAQPHPCNPFEQKGLFPRFQHIYRTGRLAERRW